jgi:hypothetical protein
MSNRTTESDSVCYTMDHDQGGDATSQKTGTCDECCAQATARVEASVTAESHYDIPFRERWPPPIKALADLQNHCHFKQAAAGGANQTAGCKELS